MGFFFPLSLPSQNWVGLFTRLWHKLKMWMSKGSLCPVLRGNRQEAGSLLEASTPLLPTVIYFICSDEEPVLRLWAQPPRRPGKELWMYSNENDKAIKAGCELGDRLKSINIAGLIWSQIIICGMAKCPFKEIWKGNCRNCTPREHCWLGLLVHWGWHKLRPLHPD